MTPESLYEGINLGLLEALPDIVGNTKNIGGLCFNAEVTAIAASGATCCVNSIGLRNLFRRSIEAGDNLAVGKREGIWTLRSPQVIHQYVCGGCHNLQSLNDEAWHPLPGATLRFRFRFVVTLRLRLGTGGGLSSAGFFASFFARSPKNLLLNVPLSGNQNDAGRVVSMLLRLSNSVEFHVEVMIHTPLKPNNWIAT